MPWPLPSPPNPLAHAPWPRGTAARPPRCAPRCRAPHRGCSTPRAGRASGRWPRGRPWLIFASPPSRRTARHQPAASSTHRPSARRAGPPFPRPRAAAAATPHHPPSSSAASSAPCETPRAAPKRQGSPGS
eukprot:scaffold83789_cov63-Phaeocystis_antarctica.AAC.12